MKIIVTGGGGFLGTGLCRALVARHYDVSSYQRKYSPLLEQIGVRQICGDLADRKAVHDALKECDAVFHNAAKAGAWGAYSGYHCTNVLGTEYVITACLKNGISRLIYTSTPSVTHRSTHPVEGGVASNVPYSSRFRSNYAASKAIAEQMVLTSNTPQLATIALRPRIIWGPGDPHFLPRLIAKARDRRLRLIGDGLNRIDTTYIDNAVQAHLDAFDHLYPGAPCAGRAYFISNNEPLPVKEFINRILQALGMPPTEKMVSFRTAFAVGFCCEKIWSFLRLSGEPPVTRFLAEQLSTPHWYSMEPARRDFGYNPKISISQGLSLLATAYKSRGRDS